jgi:hypothetical protein
MRPRSVAAAAVVVADPEVVALDRWDRPWRAGP